MRPHPPLRHSFTGTCAEQAAEMASAWLGTLRGATAATYGSYVRHYLSWCVQVGVDDPLSVRVVTAARYQRYLAGDGVSGSRSAKSVNTALGALGKLTRIAAVQGMRDESVPNPWRELDRPRPVVRRERHPVSPDEAVRLVLAGSRDTVLKGALGKLLVGLLVGLGMRPSDACRLDVSSLRRSDEGRWLLTVTAKGGRSLVHELPDELVEGLLVYQRRSRREPDGERVQDRDALLVHPRLYRRLDRRDVLALVKRSADRAGVRAGRALTCVDLRRFALERARMAGGVESARQLAGHATEGTTRRYLDDGEVLTTGRRVVASLPDWPAAELVDLVQHAYDQHEVRRPENTCSCLVPWRHARVQLRPVLGEDEVAGIEPLEGRWSGVEGKLAWPRCVCGGVYVGGYMVRTDGDTSLENRLRDAVLYPEATERAVERRDRD